LPISGEMENHFPRLGQGMEQLDELEAELDEEVKGEDVQAEDCDGGVLGRSYVVLHCRVI